MRTHLDAALRKVLEAAEERGAARAGHGGERHRGDHLRGMVREMR